METRPIAMIICDHISIVTPISTELTSFQTCKATFFVYTKDYEICFDIIYPRVDGNGSKPAKALYDFFNTLRSKIIDNVRNNQLPIIISDDEIYYMVDGESVLRSIGINISHLSSRINPSLPILN